MGMRYGVDLSKHNGDVDFGKLKADGNEFVIIRAGYGVSGTKDPKLDDYYNKAKENGMMIGFYYYSYGLSVGHGLQEAINCYSFIKDYEFDLPVFIDMEDADGYKKKNGFPSNQTLNSICNEFIDYFNKKNIKVGVYASMDWFNNKLTSLEGCYRWIAKWGSNNGNWNEDLSSICSFHQFTSKYRNQNKIFDRNVLYDDTIEWQIDNNTYSYYEEWVERLQRECNKQGFSNQIVDGINGPNTLAGCPTVRKGAKGNITKLIQERLNSVGFDIAVDGKYGDETENAVEVFQKNRGLTIDGVVGPNTWRYLLSGESYPNIN